jgi:hypothetical protein
MAWRALNISGKAIATPKKNIAMISDLFIFVVVALYLAATFLTSA